MGRAAHLFKLKQALPDIVFLDVNMPGVDGLEICRYIRRDPATTKIPIVVISANEEKAHQESGIPGGRELLYCQAADD